jgi:hypothetical protein
MTRRDWLRLLLAAPVAATIDFEKLLWQPRPLIVVPARYGLFNPKADIARMYAEGTGISMRLVQNWNADADQFVNRFDVEMLLPSLMMRVSG